MTRRLFQLAVSCFVGMLLALPVAAQDLNAAGNWNILIRMPDRNVTEHWVIEQNGHMVTVTATTTSGEKHSLAGEVNGVVFRVDSRNGEVYKVRGTVEENEMDGSVTIGNNEYLWSAKRAKT